MNIVLIYFWIMIIKFNLRRIIWHVFTIQNKEII